MPDSRTAHTAILLPNEQILIAGDGYGISATYLFNPSTKLFTFAANTQVHQSDTRIPSDLMLDSLEIRRFDEILSESR
jgi:hypothetical protein